MAGGLEASEKFSLNIESRLEQSGVESYLRKHLRDYRYFSPAVSTPQNRQLFANNLLKAYQQFNLDGIDIDWEYPALAGHKGNNVSPNDTANFLAFLQVLRKTLPATAKISAAVLTVPWVDAKGQPLKDVSAFANVLDWILLMNYDTWGCKWLSRIKY